LAIDAADVCRPLKHLSPRPGAGILQQVIDMAVSDYAITVGVDGFFGGGGGDNVFCFLGTAAPAADVLRRQGFSAQFWRTINNLSVLHACTHWTALRLAVKKALRGSQPWKRNASFLDPDVVPGKPDQHPWWTPPSDALPGKAEHIAALMRIQGAADGKARVRLAPVRYPLLSQPLVELCLRIPSWMWISGGRNRSIARDAFADQLPAEIFQRQAKGDFTSFCGAAYNRQRSALTDHLLGGWLAQHGVLDITKVEVYLKSPAPPKDISFFRLIDIAAVESWARAWT
jgi:asparagine synthase (glutamine-hydrolysing)